MCWKRCPVKEKLWYHATKNPQNTQQRKKLLYLLLVEGIKKQVQRVFRKKKQSRRWGKTAWKESIRKEGRSTRNVEEWTSFSLPELLGSSLLSGVNVIKAQHTWQRTWILLILRCKSICSFSKNSALKYVEPNFSYSFHGIQIGNSYFTELQKFLIFPGLSQRKRGIYIVGIHFISILPVTFLSVLIL